MNYNNKLNIKLNIKDQLISLLTTNKTVQETRILITVTLHFTFHKSSDQPIIVIKKSTTDLVILIL